MVRLCFKLTDEVNGVDYYIEWSNQVDSFMTRGMSKDEYTKYCAYNYGNVYMETEFDKDLARIEKTGSNSKSGMTTLEKCFRFNFSGENDTCLNREEVLEQLCRNPELYGWA